MTRIQPNYAVRTIVVRNAAATLLFVAASLVSGNGRAFGQSTDGLTSTNVQASPARILLLRNGELLRGRVATDTEHFFVFPNQGGQIRLARQNVVTVCDTPTQAYEFLAGQILTADTPARTKLVEWCLAHDLVEPAERELSKLEKVSGRSTELGTLRRRLIVKTLSRHATPMSTNSPVVPPRRRESNLHGKVSAAALTEYTKRVQPLLLNGCATANCHGRATTTDFQLHKPPRGFHSTQRLTQSNLKSILRQLDFVTPGKSPLLEMARAAHGDQPAALGIHRTKSFDTLLRWVEMTAGPVESPTASPNRVAGFPIAARASTQTTTPAGTAQANVASSVALQKTATAAKLPRDVLPPLSDLGKLPGPMQTKKPTLRQGVDPFDAEVFNEAFGASK